MALFPYRRLISENRYDHGITNQQKEKTSVGDESSPTVPRSSLGVHRQFCETPSSPPPVACPGQPPSVVRTPRPRPHRFPGVRCRPAAARGDGTDEFVGLEMARATKRRQRSGHVQRNEKGDAGNVNDLITPSPYCVVPSFDPFSLLTRLIVCTHNNHIIAERAVCVKSIVAKIHPIIYLPLRADRPCPRRPGQPPVSRVNPDPRPSRPATVSCANPSSTPRRSPRAALHRMYKRPRVHRQPAFTKH